MGILRRFFSVDYRKALAAEAQGDFISAAKHYALCGERQKVADMHLAQARTETKVDDRIRCLRSALLFLEAADERRAMVLRLLGRALRDKVQSQPCDADERRELLEEAAATLESGESWEAAGDCFLELGDRNRAAAVYARAGLLERVEEVLSEQERDQGRVRREDSCFRDYELLLQGGQRDEAAAALRTCIEAAGQKGEYRRLLTALEGQLLTAGRVELAAGNGKLVLLGRYPVVIGRDADCDLQARGASVSRHHARLELSGAELLLADCESRNGTLLNGLRIGAALPLPEAGTLGLGEDCQIEFVVAAPQTIRLQVLRGLDQGVLALVSLVSVRVNTLLPDAPDVELSFSGGRPMAREARSGGQLSLNGARVGGAVQLIKGDSVSLGDRSLRVVA